MQFWVLPSAGAVAVILLGVGWILPALWAGEPGTELSILQQDLFWLIPIGIAVYAVTVQLFSTWFVASGIRRVRSRLFEMAEPTRQGWIAAFSGTSLDKLWDRLLDLPARELPSRRHDAITVQGRFVPEAARAETVRLYQATLFRTQFFSAIVLLLAIAALEWAEGATGLVAAQSAMPVGSLLVMTCLVAILAVFGRLLIDASAERLVDTIDNLPVERLDIRLFSRLTELIERATSAPPPPAAASPPAALVGSLVDRFSPILEECRGSFLDATTRLLANADALNAAVAAIAERAGTAEIAAGPAPAIEFAAALERLQQMIDEFAEISRQARFASSAASDGLQLAADSPEREQFSNELREMLKEFE